MADKDVNIRIKASFESNISSGAAKAAKAVGLLSQNVQSYAKASKAAAVNSKALIQLGSGGAGLGKVAVALEKSVVALEKMNTSLAKIDEPFTRLETSLRKIPGALARISHEVEVIIETFQSLNAGKKKEIIIDVTPVEDGFKRASIAAKKFSDDGLKKVAKAAKTASKGVKKLDKDLDNLEEETKSNTSSMSKLFASLKKGNLAFAILSTSIVNAFKIMDGLKNKVNEVTTGIIGLSFANRRILTHMENLQRQANESASGMAQFRDIMNQVALDAGLFEEELLDQASALAATGISLKDTTKGLIGIAEAYKRTGISLNQLSQDFVSLLKGEAEGVINASRRLGVTFTEFSKEDLIRGAGLRKVIEVYSAAEEKADSLAIILSRVGAAWRESFRIVVKTVEESKGILAVITIISNVLIKIIVGVRKGIQEVIGLIDGAFRAVFSALNAVEVIILRIDAFIYGMVERLLSGLDRIPGFGKFGSALGSIFGALRQNSSERADAAKQTPLIDRVLGAKLDEQGNAQKSFFNRMIDLTKDLSEEETRSIFADRLFNKNLLNKTADVEKAIRDLELSFIKDSSSFNASIINAIKDIRSGRKARQAALDVDRAEKTGKVPRRFIFKASDDKGDPIPNVFELGQEAYQPLVDASKTLASRLDNSEIPAVLEELDALRETVQKLNLPNIDLRINPIDRSNEDKALKLAEEQLDIFSGLEQNLEANAKIIESNIKTTSDDLKAIEESTKSQLDALIGRRRELLEPLQKELIEAVRTGDKKTQDRLKETIEGRKVLVALERRDILANHKEEIEKEKEGLDLLAKRLKAINDKDIEEAKKAAAKARQTIEEVTARIEKRIKFLQDTMMLVANAIAGLVSLPGLGEESNKVADATEKSAAKNFDKIEELREELNDIKGTSEEAVKQRNDLLSKIGQEFESLEKLGEGTVENLVTLDEELKKQNAEAGKDAAKDVIGDVASAAVEAFVPGGEFLAPYIKPLLDLLDGSPEQIQQAVSVFTKGVISLVTGIIKNLPTIVRALLDGIFDGIYGPGGLIDHLPVLIDALIFNSTRILVSVGKSLVDIFQAIGAGLAAALIPGGENFRQAYDRVRASQNTAKSDAERRHKENIERAEEIAKFGREGARSTKALLEETKKREKEFAQGTFTDPFSLDAKKDISTDVLTAAEAFNPFLDPEQKERLPVILQINIGDQRLNDILVDLQESGYQVAAA